MPENEIEKSLVKEAKAVLQGKYLDPLKSLALAKKLKTYKQFGYARRILARARKDEDAVGKLHPEQKLEIYQQSALCTYKDSDLPVDSRLDRALEILRIIEDLSTTRNAETLGITGAIYKRKWEVDNQKPQLERALFYYLRGYEASSATGQRMDQGYNGINAAYILDLLAHQEMEEAERARVPAGSSERKRIEERRKQAARIRRDIIYMVTPLLDGKDTNWLQGKWWFYSTLAEAYFGLGGRGNEAHYDIAVYYLEKGVAAAKPAEWEFESTVRQLAHLARLQAPPGTTNTQMEAMRAWTALERFLGHSAPVRSAFYGKIGLGLSGGGFRASLYHIGVLARLAELDVLHRIEVLSCVSGGSIIGAHYYLELRKLLHEKRDPRSEAEYRDSRPSDQRDWITHQDYVDIIRRVACDFLEGVQRNVRTLVAAEAKTNMRMIFGAETGLRRKFFGPGYSRTQRVGELFESEIFKRVADGAGGADRWLDKLQIQPKGEPDGFHPKYHNWRREAKVPILVLNAATLNTGHTWHFTAKYMGEPPAGIDSEVDGNDRLRRMYYDEAPDPHKGVRLGHAVAASACVPGLFEPIALDGLYPERIVRLVDGGTCDNQGVGALLEQDCNVILISDGSGQMESLKDPGAGLLDVPLRSTSILQARVRQAQFQDLSSRKRSQLLRGFMFVHLKADLDVDPVDWIRCTDPYDANDDDARPPSRRGKRTRYGIDKEVQQLLASVRTDLDSFSDVEAYALMTSGYRQTELAFAEGKCVEGFGGDVRPEPWEFLKVESGMQPEGEGSEFLKRLLGVSGKMAFKIWALQESLHKWSRRLRNVLIAFLVLLVLGGIVAAWLIPGNLLWKAIALGAFGLIVGLALVIVSVLGKSRGSESLVRIAVGFAGVLGSVAAKVHLKYFDPKFLKYGSLERFLRESGAGAAGAPVPTPQGSDGAQALPFRHDYTGAQAGKPTGDGAEVLQVADSLPLAPEKPRAQQAPGDLPERIEAENPERPRN